MNGASGVITRQVQDTGPGIDERERLLIEAVMSLARTLRDERDRLTERLRDVENQLTTLVTRLDARRLDPTPTE